MFFWGHFGQIEGNFFLKYENGSPLPLKRKLSTVLAHHLNYEQRENYDWINTSEKLKKGSCISCGKDTNLAKTFSQ